MKAKYTVLLSFLMAVLPTMATAQTTDDLYYIPKKAKKEAIQQVNTEAKTSVQGKTVVVRDAKGNYRDVDEYNRRYNIRNKRYSSQNDTIYVDETDYNQRGEWVNGFDGTQDDYEYAMRLIRFRNPRYAVSISSPLYWDIIHGAFASWDWNIYDDGLYAYVFPTFSNRFWWNWRHSWGGYYGSYWNAPWYYGGWGYGYYGYWSHPYGWGSYYGAPYYYGGYYGGWSRDHYVRRYYNYNDRRDYGYSRGNRDFNQRNTNSYNRSNNSYGYTRGTDYNNNRQNILARPDGASIGERRGGRVITTDNSRNINNTGRYVRSTQSGNTYSRPSSTRSGSYSGNGAFERMQNNTQRNSSYSNSSYNTRGSSYSSGSSSSFNNSNRGSSMSTGSSSRSGGSRRR